MFHKFSLKTSESAPVDEEQFRASNRALALALVYDSLDPFELVELQASNELLGSDLTHALGHQVIKHGKFVSGPKQ